MTRAQLYREKKPADGWEDTNGWLTYVESIDAAAVVTKTDLGTAIMFSDGSLHRLARS